VLFAGATRYMLPLPPGLEKKWTALGRVLDYRVLARGSGQDQRFRLVGDFYAGLPFRVREEIGDFRPHAIVAEDLRTATLVMLGRATARSGQPRVIAEVHGNWRHATRLYGSPARRLASPLVDRLDEYGVRHADAVRALSGYTARLVEEARHSPPTAVFPTYSDLSAFTALPLRPLPERPTALFVGVLERYKNVDGLAAAWRLASPRIPDARLVLVGKGSLQPVVDSLTREQPGRVKHVPELTPEHVAASLDEATVLVLASRFEGLGRVVIEAFARGRGVIGGRGGGILDLVEEGREGLLVDPEDVDGLAGALVRCLSDRELAERLGRAARERFPDWNQSAEQFAQRMRALVDAALD
jgi:glycosyltransferase involved in cell wall biosynthesis